ncbi:integrase core domain-containing protein [Pannonibacter phragmitetus]
MLNGFVESFNGCLRDECLNEHLFRSYHHAREIPVPAGPNSGCTSHRQQR